MIRLPGLAGRDGRAGWRRRRLDRRGRVTFWGALAMAITAGVGALFGAVV